LKAGKALPLWALLLEPPLLALVRQLALRL
jgi:hypothetical protein